MIRFRIACWFCSCDCCWFNVCWNANGSNRARTCPALTTSPTLTSISLIWAPLGKPRFWDEIDARAPDADTLVETEPRCTELVADAGADTPQPVVARSAESARTPKRIRVRALARSVIKALSCRRSNHSTATGATRYGPYYERNLQSSDRI